MDKDAIYNAVMRNSDMYNELAESMKLPLYRRVFWDQSGELCQDFRDAVSNYDSPYAKFSIEHNGIVNVVFGDLSFYATPGWESDEDYIVPIQFCNEHATEVATLNLLECIVNLDDGWARPYDVYFEEVLQAIIKKVFPKLDLDFYTAARGLLESKLAYDAACVRMASFSNPDCTPELDDTLNTFINKTYSDDDNFLSGIDKVAALYRHLLHELPESFASYAEDM